MASIESQASYNSTDYERNFSAYKPGLNINYIEFEEMRYRNPFGSALCDGITQAALGDGFDLVDEEGEELPINEAFQLHFDEVNFLQEFIQGVGHTRAYGSAGLIVFDNGELKAFNPKDIFFSMNQSTRQMQEVRVIERFAWNSLPDFDHEIKLHNDPLKDFFIYMIHKNKERTFAGESVLESPFDILEGINIIWQMAIILSARVGAGIKTLYWNPKDDAEKNKLLNYLERLNYTTRALFPKDAKFELYQPSGNFDFMSIFDLMLNALAGGTGIPITFWKGNVPGQQSGAEQNTTQLFEYFTGIQDKCFKDLIKLIKLVGQVKNFALPPEFTIVWRKKQEVSEEKEGQIEKTKSEKAILDGRIKTGNEIRKELDLSPLSIFDEENVPLDVLYTRLNSMFTVGINDQETNMEGINEDESESKSNKPEQPDPRSEQSKPESDKPEGSEAGQPEE